MHDVNLNRGDHYPTKYMQDLLDRLKALHHLHWEILAIIKYSKIINDLAKKLKIANVFFVNGFCPWDENYFVRLENTLPESYTSFTKKEILNIDTRDDKDIFELYHRAHDQYQKYLYKELKNNDCVCNDVLKLMINSYL
jgi:hypothetical protein